MPRRERRHLAQERSRDPAARRSGANMAAAALGPARRAGRLERAVGVMCWKPGKPAPLIARSASKFMRLESKAVGRSRVRDSQGREAVPEGDERTANPEQPDGAAPARPPRLVQTAKTYSHSTRL